VDYRTLETLRHTHPAWRLLTAEHAPLIASFLHDTFVKPNIRTLSQPQLVTRLDDHLYMLHAELGDDAFPKEPLQYLDGWASDESGWLRKYYPPDDDEAHFDITPATEKAIDWLSNLSQRQFVGTESRLLTVFELLRQLAEGTETDPWARIAKLEQRKEEIETEMQRIRGGDIYLLDTTRVKERFLQLTATARGLLSDFREVEQNFRSLDRDVRQHIATWGGGKAELLEQVFGVRDSIAESDQGKSFHAFWDFLMSPTRQEELTSLLAKVFALEPVQELEPDRRLLRIHFDWLQAGETTQRTVARLSEQLRRYLDDKVWLENRRIMEIIRNIEQTALLVREDAPDGPFIDLNEAKPTAALAMDRPLFSPPLKPQIADLPPVDTEDIPTDALFEQSYVDKDRLSGQIRRALQRRTQISLAELVDLFPLERGLAELVAYFSLAAEDHAAIIDDTQSQTLIWADGDGTSRQATFPRVVFCRDVTAPSTMHGTTAQ
jgi:uncharacterized protein DUF3375